MKKNSQMSYQDNILKNIIYNKNDTLNLKNETNNVFNFNENCIELN